ncbi:hypothetical protein ACFL54_07480 [Planctomycetota bacterium]
MNIEQFEETLLSFKDNERPEVLLFVTNNDPLIKIILVWPNVPIERSKKKFPALSEKASTEEKWNWLWRCVRFDQEDIGDLLGSKFGVDKKIKVLIANRILYPDGSIHSYVTRYLRDRVVKLFEAKSRRSKAGKTSSK